MQWQKPKAPRWYLKEPFMLRVLDVVKKDESLMSQESLPEYGNIPTMAKMISLLKQKATKK